MNYILAYFGLMCGLLQIVTGQTTNLNLLNILNRKIKKTCFLFFNHKFKFDTLKKKSFIDFILLLVVRNQGF